MYRALRSAAPIVVFPLVYALAVIVGRATRLVGDGEVSLVWPAAAVGVVWLLSVRNRGPGQRAAHVALLGVTSFVTTLATDGSVALSAWFVVVNLVLSVVCAELLAAGRDEVVLRDPADLGRLVIAVVAGTGSAAVLATAYFVVVADAQVWGTFALFITRNGATVLLGVAIWLCLRDVTWTRPHLTAASTVELLLASTVAVVVFVWIFWLIDSGLPMAFLAMVPVMWLALRFSTTVSTLFLAAAGIWVVYATVMNRGVLIVPDVQTRALLAQIMVGSLTVIMLTLSLYRDSRARLITEVEQARDLFAGVLKAASEQAIIGTDRRGRVAVFNHGAERLLGWTEAEVLGRRPIEFHYYPEVCARAEELGVGPSEVFVHNVGPDRAEVREWTYVRRDGSHVAVSVAVSQMTDRDGRFEGYIGVATDITEQKAAERALAASEEQFRLAFDTAPMGMFMFTIAPQPPGRITRCNHALAEFLGRPTDEVLTMTVLELENNEISCAKTGLHPLLTLGIGQRLERELCFRRAGDEEVWGAVSASVVAPAGSEPYGIGLVEDITTRKRVEAELLHMASHDPLTGLANRALLTDRIMHAIAEVDSGRSIGLGLISLDLDGFKEVNDTWGHAEGDEVLTEVAARIAIAIRPGDTAGRLGGDEFAVLCPGLFDVAELQSLAERIRTELCRPLQLSSGEVYERLSVSSGVVTSRGATDAATLLRQADMLMYHAKRRGKNCVALP